tara:strand:+ start:155 stop:307 length:153 start_codon:yes stop_codon:yes gene_type:complete
LKAFVSAGAAGFALRRRRSAAQRVAEGRKIAGHALPLGGPARIRAHAVLQ